MPEAMNYSKSRNTQENKDLLKTINDSLDNDGLIDSAEAKLINEKYKNLKSTTLAISKNELGNLAKGLGLDESSSLFKTINKLKELSNPLTSIDSTIPNKKENEEGEDNLETNEEFKLGKDYLKRLISSEGVLLTSEFIGGKASMLMYGREKGQVSIEEFDELVKKLDELMKSDLSDYEKNKKISVQILMSYPPKIDIQVSGKAFRINMGIISLFEIPSETEIQREKNIKKTILDGFKEKGIFEGSVWPGLFGVDFEGGNDKEIYLKMVDDFVSIINKKEKEVGVFLKNSVIKNLIQNDIFDMLKRFEDEKDFFDDVVDKEELGRLKQWFSMEISNLLVNPDNFQTEEDIIGGNRGLTEGKGGNATGLGKDPSDNKRRNFRNGGGKNSGFSGGGDGNGGNDPRRRIKKGEKWTSNKNGIDGIKSNNENSKYGITPETRKKVNEKLIELGMKPAKDKEINETERQSNTVKENNNIDRIIKEIKSNRDYEKKEDIRRVKSGFDEKEYYYDDELMEKYSNNFNKPIQSINDAISSIFTKHNSDGLGRYIKKDDMTKLLEEYFKINTSELTNIIYTDNNGNIVNKNGTPINPKENIQEL